MLQAELCHMTVDLDVICGCHPPALCSLSVWVQPTYGISNLPARPAGLHSFPTESFSRANFEANRYILRPDGTIFNSAQRIALSMPHTCVVCKLYVLTDDWMSSKPNYPKEKRRRPQQRGTLGFG